MTHFQATTNQVLIPRNKDLRRPCPKPQFTINRPPSRFGGWLGKSIAETDPTYLYVIEFASKPDRIKIGVARDPLRRLTAIDVSRDLVPLPYGIRHLFLLEDAHQIEKGAQIHLWKQWRSYWGELFELPT